MIRVQQVGGSLVNAVGIGTQQTSGPLCVCRTTDEVPQKFRSGDVLVVPYTTNDMLPYLREAAAIISEEASPDCHTATVGLLLGKARPARRDGCDAAAQGRGDGLSRLRPRRCADAAAVILGRNRKARAVKSVDIGKQVETQ